MRIEGYIPKDIYDDARYFISEIDGDCLIYKIFRDNGRLKATHETEAFYAFWELARYVEKPEALHLLLENKDFIDRQIFDLYGDSVAQFAFDIIMLKLTSYYKLLHDEGVINE